MVLLLPLHFSSILCAFESLLYTRIEPANAELQKSSVPRKSAFFIYLG